MRQHDASGRRIAEWLARRSDVTRLYYPGLPSHPQHDVARRMLPRGFGGMAAFEVVGGVEAGQRFCDALELIWVAASLGGIHTLVCHAASTTHRQLDADARRAAGIADGLIRLSVGLEDVEDLIEDVDRALEKA
jgi:methionine-gamma-lyase